MDLVENTISIIRFSVTGSSNQLFNYIPLLKGSFTKVNVNYVILYCNKMPFIEESSYDRHFVDNCFNIKAS